jgi:hypothetical protein
MENDKNQSQDIATPQACQRLSGLEPTEQYVGLIDILGWNRYVRTDFKRAVEVYDWILDNCNFIKGLNPVPSMRIFSDSILLVSAELASIMAAANTLQYAALFQDCLVRGGIARGRHVELGSQAQLYVVSEALVYAATLEKEVKKPCIVLDPRIVPPIPSAVLRAINPFQRLMLFFDGLWIVNPFNIAWGTSAATRVTQLKERYPEYSDKYDWFLRLYDAVKSWAPLEPTDRE